MTAFYSFQNVFQFSVAKRNLLKYDHEALEFTKDIALLAQQRSLDLFNAVSATLLGISAYEGGLK